MEEKNTQNMNEATTTGALSVKTIARELGVSKATVLRWVHARKITGFFRIGHKWLIRKSDFDAFLSGQVAQHSENNSV